MSDSFKKYLLPIILILFTIGIWLYNPKPKPTRINTPSSAAPIINPISPVYKPLSDSTEGEKTYLEIETALIKHMELDRDPFVKKGAPVSWSYVNAAAQKSLSLQGIWDSEDEKIAFINGNMLRVGQKINGYKVTEILEKQVKLIKYGKIITLSITRASPGLSQSSQSSSKKSVAGAQKYRKASHDYGATGKVSKVSDFDNMNKAVPNPIGTDSSGGGSNPLSALGGGGSGEGSMDSIDPAMLQKLMGK